MKRISTLLLSIALVVFAQAQTTYTISQSTSWNATLPGNCNSCTINIAPNATLTIDRNVTTQNITINGGNVSIVNANVVNLQTNNGGRSKFNNTKVVVNSSARVSASGMLELNNSSFTFKNTSYITTSNVLELNNSRINFFSESYLSVPSGTVNLKNNSILVAGDGSLNSDAHISFGLFTSLNVYDNSAIIVAGNNNYYYNLGAYYGALSNKTFSTAINSYNCQWIFGRPCSIGAVYGPVNMLGTGVSLGNALPVLLSDFAVRLYNGIVQLNWTTDQESNSNRFEVERSTDGATWNKIAVVAAKGNSTVETNYAYTDRTPAGGVNYYRLKMVDMDNSFEYSETKSVRAAFAANVKVYPNPASSNVHVSIPAATNVVRLMNTAGQVLQERRSVAAHSTVSFDVSSYPAGTYMIQVMQADGTAQNNVLLIAK